MHAVSGLDTCGVTIDKEGRYVLVWDPEWFTKQEVAFQILVILHEAAHLVLRHVERGITHQRRINVPAAAAMLQEVWNIAADMAANDVALRSMVEDKTKNFGNYASKILWPEDKDYPRGRSADEYYAWLLRDLKSDGWTPENSDDSNQGNHPGSNSKNKQQGNGSNVPQWFKNLAGKKTKDTGATGIFDTMTDSEVRRAIDRARREVRRITNAAVKQTEKARGTIPGNIKATVEDLLEDSKIPWQELLRGQLRSVISQKLDESTAYPNVTLLHSDEYEPYPGFQKNFTFNILAAFDTSGSMDDKDFVDCCSELRGLLEKEDGVTVRLLHFDWKIQHEETLTTTDTAQMTHSNTRYGYGGTSFKSPLRYALHQDEDRDWELGAKRINQKHRTFFDLMVIFTDGYAPIPLPELDPHIPLFWILTSNGQIHDQMKYVLRMED
jgi:predicted metal-dependent peptidase